MRMPCWKSLSMHGIGIVWDTAQARLCLVQSRSRWCLDAAVTGRSMWRSSRRDWLDSGGTMMTVRPCCIMIPFRGEPIHIFQNANGYASYMNLSQRVAAPSGLHISCPHCCWTHWRPRKCKSCMCSRRRSRVPARGSFKSLSRSFTPLKSVVDPWLGARQEPRENGQSAIWYCPSQVTFDVCVLALLYLSSSHCNVFVIQVIHQTIWMPSLCIPSISHVLSGCQTPFRGGAGRNWGLVNPGLGLVKVESRAVWPSKCSSYCLCGLRTDWVSRWTTKHLLHLTASFSSTSLPSSLQTPLPLLAEPAMASLMTLTLPTEPKTSFTTAFAMLLYNICYLTHTQSVEIPLSQAGDALGNLWAVCCSGELGQCVVYHLIVFCLYLTFLSLAVVHTKQHRVYHLQHPLHFHLTLHRSFKQRLQVRQGVDGVLLWQARVWCGTLW